MAKIKSEDLKLNIIVNGAAKAAKDVGMAGKSISELQKELKLAKKALAQAIPGTENFKQLQQTVKATSDRLRELQGGAKSTSSIIGKMAGGFTLGGLALKGIGAAGDLARKALTDMTTATQEWGDRWQIAVAGVKAGWQQFIANLAAGSNAVHRSVSEAVRDAREAAALTDELFERHNSLSIEERRTQREINELQAVAMDSSLDAGVRLAALDQILDKEEHIAAVRKDIAKQDMEAAKLGFNAKMTDEELNFLIVEYNKNREIITQATEYNQLLKKRNSLQNAQMFSRGPGDYGASAELDELNRQIAEVDDGVKKVATTVANYNLSNDEIVTNYVNALKAYEDAEVELSSVVAGQARRRGTLKKQIAAETKAADDKAYADELAAAQNTYDQTMLALKTSLLDKEMSQEDFDKRALEAETKLLNDKIAVNKKYGKDIVGLENQIADKRIAAQAKQEGESNPVEVTDADKDEKDASAFVSSLASESVEAENARYQKALENFEKFKDKFQDQTRVLETIERQHRNNLAKIKLDNLDKEMAGARNGDGYQKAEELRAGILSKKQELQNATGAQATNLRTQIRRDESEAVLAQARADIEYYTEYLERLEAIKTEAESSAGNDAEVSAITKKIAEVRQQAEEAQDIINGKTQGVLAGAGGGSLFGVSQEQWTSLFDNIKEGKMQAEDLKNVFGAIGDAAEQGLQIASQAISMVNAKENAKLKEEEKRNEKEKKGLKNKLDSKQMTQAQYDQAVSEMDDEMAAKKEEIEIRQAKRAKAMNIAQAAINTAMSVSRAFVDWPWPASIAVAAIMAALGAAQIGMIAATPAYASGGPVLSGADGKIYDARLSPDKRGYVSGPTLLVGEKGGEYVIPADGLANPSLAPVLATIEQARKAGTLKSLDFGAAYGARAVRARADGGYSSSRQGVRDAASDSSGTESQSVSGERVLDLLGKILDKMDDPTPAYVNYLGRGGIKEAQDKYERYRSKGIMR